MKPDIFHALFVITGRFWPRFPSAGSPPVARPGSSLPH
jgi:hypothetical protein